MALDETSLFNSELNTILTIKAERKKDFIVPIITGIRTDTVIAIIQK
ncbi:hypothetical protein [Flavobacterium petrolei]|nr:hypothetical protein [Flavobacterium sp.]